MDIKIVGTVSESMLEDVEHIVKLLVYEQHMKSVTKALPYTPLPVKKHARDVKWPSQVTMERTPTAQVKGLC